MPTIRDLVKLCPGCGKTVVWPFTQDFDPRAIKLVGGFVENGTMASDAEMAILRRIFPDIAFAAEVGVRISSAYDDQGRMWHEPCLVLQTVHAELLQITRLVSILQWAIDNRKFK
jgi:hypothetical protein